MLSKTTISIFCNLLKNLAEKEKLVEINRQVLCQNLNFDAYQVFSYLDLESKNYLNVLKPEYIIITNDIGGIFMDTAKYLEKNKINYLYSTYDQYEVSATITNDNIFLGFGTKGIKQFRDKIYYIKEEVNKKLEISLKKQLKRIC